MRVYVASSFHRKQDVRAMQIALCQAGHEITVDWTPEDATGMHGKELYDYMQRAAEVDLRGVEEAHAIVVIHDDRGRGMATELGIAIARGILVVVVGGQPHATAGADEMMRNVFYYLPNVKLVDNTTEVIDLLKEFSVIETDMFTVIERRVASKGFKIPYEDRTGE